MALAHIVVVMKRRPATIEDIGSTMGRLPVPEQLEEPIRSQRKEADGDPLAQSLE